MKSGWGNTYHSDLTAHVVVGTHTEVTGRHTGGQIDARQEPADDDAEQARNAEEDQGATGAASHTDHQDSAQE